MHGSKLDMLILSLEGLQKGYLNMVYKKVRGWSLGGASSYITSVSTFPHSGLLLI